MKLHPLYIIFTALVLGASAACTSSPANATCESGYKLACEKAAPCSTDGNVRLGDVTYDSTAKCIESSNSMCQFAASLGVSRDWQACTDAVNSGQAKCEDNGAGQKKLSSPAACSGK